MSGPLDLGPIKARLADATKGPWMQGHHVGEPKAICAAARPMTSLLGLDVDGMAIVERESDAALIAHAPTDLDALVLEIESLRGALKDALDEWEYAASYKGEFLSWKHEDAERIAKARALLPVAAHPAERP